MGVGVGKVVHGSTQEAGSANKLMRLWSPAGKFAYRSKGMPEIAFLLLCLLFIHSHGRFFSPMAKNRSKEDSRSKWGSEGLNSNTCCLILLCPKAHERHMIMTIMRVVATIC